MNPFFNFLVPRKKGSNTSNDSSYVYVNISIKLLFLMTSASLYIMLIKAKD
jgi:hypothetical protein